MTVVRIRHDAAAALLTGRPMEALMLTVLDAVADRARIAAPKESGAGAASIHGEIVTEGGEIVGRVGWDAEHFYMRFAEEGNSRQSATPFLRPALDSPVL